MIEIYSCFFYEIKILYGTRFSVRPPVSFSPFFKRLKAKYDGHENIMVHIWAYGHNNRNIQLYFYKMKILYVARFSVLPSISELEPVFFFI